MNRRLLILAHIPLALAWAAPAQTVSALNSPPTQEALDALAAQIPQPSSTAPVADMAVDGAVGSSPRYRRVDDQAPRISRTVTGSTLSTGLGVVTWPAMTAPPKLTVTPYVASGASQAPICFPVIGTVTNTGATIRCFTTQSVTVSLLGAVVAPLTTAAAGVTFDVLALPAS